MKRTFTAVLALLVLFAFAECADIAHAATPCVTVRHLSVPNGSAVLDTFTAARFDGQTGNVFNFSGTCDNTPPPTPGFAPNALTTATVKYMATTAGNTSITVPVRDFANLAGRLSSRDPITGFGYVGGSTWQIPSVRGDQILQSVITVPRDAPIGHLFMFGGVLYGAGVGVGNLSSSAYPIDVRVYEVNGATGVFETMLGANGLPRPGANKTNLRMNDSTLLYFVTGPSANQSFVPISPGGVYVVEVKWHDLAPATRGNFMFSWNG
jgi:hypothetical protein